jgi:23S rRNA pseudouridine1911/1915/1917 synthase
MEAEYSPPSPAGLAQAAIPAEYAGLRLDQALVRLFPAHSRARLQAWIESGRVRVDGARAARSRKVWGGERVEVDAEPAPATLAATPEELPLAVVHEDADLLVIDKPAGLVVHPGSGNWSGTLMNALLARGADVASLPRAGIVHRLDKDTSGLLVVARTLEAHTELVCQLQARVISRRYLAVALGRVAGESTVDAPIGRDPRQRTRMAVVADGREARTRVLPREHGKGWTLVECALETGRTHQIRVHLASIGHPLLGDPVYGARALPPALAARVDGFRRQALHAWRLALEHPRTGEPMAWGSPLPADFEALLARLRQP